MVAELLKARNLPALKSRKEMLSLLEKEYGKMPGDPVSVSFKAEENRLPCRKVDVFCSGNARVWRVTAEVTLESGTFSFPFQAVVPISEEKVPFIVSVNFHDAIPDLWMPTEEIVDSGFAVFSFCYESVSCDRDDFRDGVAGVLFEDGKRDADSPGKIALWAWGAQRVLDYALTLDCLDHDSAAVCGFSRLGKTALLAAATDERFRFCYSNESGCCGAALFRGKTGESKARITSAFPYWFSKEFGALPDEPEQLPFDQHYLIASIAPRYVLIGSASEDAWCDPVSEFLSGAAASPAYEEMGLEGLVHADSVPEYDGFLPEGRIGYHIRPGKHYFSRTDWQRFMAFIQKHHSAPGSKYTN